MAEAIVNVYEREPGHVFTEQPTPPNYPEPGLRGAIGVLGWTTWGPLELTRVSSYEQWKAMFGGSGDLPTDKQIEKLYKNAESVNSKAPLFFKRVLHYSDIGTAGSYDAVKAETYIYDGNATAASIGTATADVGNGGDATATEGAGPYTGTDNGVYKVEVTTAGAYGTGEVTISFTPEGGIETVLGTETPGAGTEFDLDATTGIAMTLADGGSGNLTLGDIWTIEVIAEGKAVGDRRIKVLSKYLGSYGNNFSIEVANDSEDVDGNFKLIVYKDGVSVETFDNLSPDVDEARYFETYVNMNSSFIKLEDMSATNIEDVGTSQSSGLSGGDDGSAVVKDDYDGSAVTSTGLHGFSETKTALRIGNFDAEVEADPQTWFQSMLNYCSGTNNRCFSFLSAPESIISESNFLSFRSGFLADDSEYGRLFAGWLYDDETGELMSPTGAMLGLNSRRGREVGAWAEDAGPAYTLKGFTGVNISFTSETNGKLNEVGFSVMKYEAGTGVYCNGLRTLTKTKKRNYKYVPQMLLPQEIEYEIERNTGWVRFKSLSNGLYANVKNSVGGILGIYNAANAFNTEDGAPFAVICDNGIQTLEMKNQGIILCKWGIRTRFHAEFVWFDFTNMTSGATL